MRPGGKTSAKSMTSCLKLASARLLGDEQVAIFRPYYSDQVFAISNIDLFFESSRLSRGLIDNTSGELWVASLLKNSVSLK